MKNDLLVSIVMPIYNAEDWIKNAIQAIQNQTYESWELILIDDGSTDSTLKLCKKYSSLDKRIQVYSQENQGPSSARNFGLSKIKGDYFLLIDSDDLLPENSIEKYICALIENDADIAIGGFIKNNIFKCEKTKINIKNKIVFSIDNNLNILELETLLNNGLMASNWNKMYRNKFFNLRFNESLSINEDVLYSLEALYQSSKVVVIPDIVYEYKIQNSNSVSLKFHQELPKSVDFLYEIVTRTQEQELKVGIINWLMNYLYIQLKIIINLDIQHNLKKSYIKDLINCKVFRKYGKIKYADTYNRKVATLLLNFNCIYIYMLIMEMREKL